LKNNGIKSTIVTLTVLAIAGCNNGVPNNTSIGNGLRPVPTIENFSDLEKEYVFTTKALTESYLLRKLLSWLGPPEKGPQLVKEIAFAIFKYPDLFRDVLHNPGLLGRINAVQAVIDRKAIDPPFAAFLDNSVPEFQVNTYTTGVQDIPKVAVDAAGNFIITWSSDQEGDGGYGVYAQRYNSAGTATGPELHVNNYTNSWQSWNDIAMDQDGDFVITWNSFGQDGSVYGIYARRYNKNGEPQPCPGTALDCTDGGEFRVNSFTESYQESPSIAMDKNGDFIITWFSYGQDDGGGIYAQRYKSDGEPKPCPAGAPECNATTGEFRVNSFTNGLQAGTSVAMDENGNFVVTWASYSADKADSDVRAQRYNSNGVITVPEFPVNITYTAGRQRYAYAAMDKNSNFMILWNSMDQDGDGNGVYARRFDSNGTQIVPGGCGSALPGCTPATGEFQVNSQTAGEQDWPQAVIDTDGDFVITWQSGDYYTPVGPDGSYIGVYARRYHASGAPEGPEFLVNSFTGGSQAEAAIGMSGLGDYIIAWCSGSYTIAENMQDGDLYGIYAKRYNSNGIAQ
jgi:hypothetical protein